MTTRAGTGAGRAVASTARLRAMVAGIALLLALAGARAASPAPVVYGARAGVAPGRVHLGEVAIYRGQIVHPRDRRLRWRVPATGGELTWGPLAALHVPDARAVPDAQAIDTLRARITVQAFAIGRFGIPGLPFESRGPRGTTVHSLPTVTLVVQPIVPPADSAPSLRPVRGPLAAPWWERVPWTWVALGLLLIAAIVALIVWRKRRKPAAPPVVTPALDPAAEAFAALAALRGLHLPEHGRFAEHAFHLTRILRRFLERTQGVTRPGHTTPELVDRLGQGPLAAGEIERVADLLRAWDRVKFARAATTTEEARRAETAIEDFVRRAAPAPEKEAA